MQKYGGKKHAFIEIQRERRVHQAVLKDCIPCPHNFCAGSGEFYEKNGISHHFRVVNKIPNFTDKNLQESLAFKRRLHVNETPLYLQE